MLPQHDAKESTKLFEDSGVGSMERGHGVARVSLRTGSMEQAKQRA